MPLTAGLRAAARHALVIAALAAPVAPAVACPSAAPEVASAQSASSGSLRLAFDWYANGAATRPRADRLEFVRAVDRQRLGQGSWICSPSGSGMLSHCFAR